VLCGVKSGARGRRYPNTLGSFLMAVIMEIFALRSVLPLQARLFLTTGLLGGYTTFSTFTLDAMFRLERGEWAVAVLYVILSVAGAMTAFLGGMALVRQVLAAAP
jgi:fluoride exporter